MRLVTSALLQSMPSLWCAVSITTTRTSFNRPLSADMQLLSTPCFNLEASSNQLIFKTLAIWQASSSIISSRRKLWPASTAPKTAPSLQSSNELHHHLTHAILIKTYSWIYQPLPISSDHPSVNMHKPPKQGWLPCLPISKMHYQRVHCQWLCLLRQKQARPHKNWRLITWLSHVQTDHLVHPEEPSKQPEDQTLCGYKEPSSQELKKVIIKIYCIKKCLLDLDPI